MRPVPIAYPWLRHTLLPTVEFDSDTDRPTWVTGNRGIGFT
jgi:hypothetical protein